MWILVCFTLKVLWKFLWIISTANKILSFLTAILCKLTLIHFYHKNDDESVCEMQSNYLKMVSGFYIRDHPWTPWIQSIIDEGGCFEEAIICFSFFVMEELTLIIKTIITMRRHDISLILFLCKSPQTKSLMQNIRVWPWFHLVKKGNLV